jgi:hypothetical protein
MASKFIVIRKDLNIDPSMIESEGLTIGRLVGNDVTLNHPAVSRTHAGIKEEMGEFWIFNLSNANGTILNGVLVDRSPLAAGDILQIGPFTIFVSFPNNQLALSVEMSVNPLRAEGAGTSMLAPPDASGKTQMLSPAMLQAQAQSPTAKGTQRLAKTGMLTGMLGKPEEEALQVFWDKRKRDAGKMAESTRLRPNLLGGRVGKARFNWRSTSDLRRPWPVSLFVWGTLVVGVLSILGAVVFKNIYSPGPLSTPHQRASFSMPDETMRVATTVNDNSCTTCHSLTTSMQDKCVGCHTSAAFKPAASSEHEMVGVSCGECHGGEHNGEAFNMMLTAKDSCVACHRADYVYKSHKDVREIRLATPHGGDSIGYPVTNGNWTWAGWSEDKWKGRKLPKTAAAFDAKGQFHVIHVANGDAFERVECSDCHTQGFDTALITKGVKESCVACHNANPQQGAAASGQMVAGAQCTSCHQQHTTGKDTFALVRSRQIQTGKK